MIEKFNQKLAEEDESILPNWNFDSRSLHYTGEVTKPVKMYVGYTHSLSWWGTSLWHHVYLELEIGRKVRIWESKQNCYIVSVFDSQKDYGEQVKLSYQEFILFLLKSKLRILEQEIEEEIRTSFLFLWQLD